MKEKVKILYIDDDELSLDYFKTVLSDKFGEITTASSGMEGVNKFFENLPDIVIVDIIMPDINGVEVAVKIKEKYSDVQIVAVSSSDSSENLMGAINAGIRNFILKPVSAEKIYKIIDNIIEEIKIRREVSEYRKKLEETVEIRTSRFQRISEKLINEMEERGNIEKKYSVIMEIMEQSPIGQIVTDLGFNIEYINKKAAENIVSEYKDLAGRKLNTVLLDLDTDKMEEKIRKDRVYRSDKYVAERVKGKGNFDDLYQIMMMKY